MEYAMNINQLFSLENKVAIVTGGTGVLGGAMARGLAAAGAAVGILGRRAVKAAQVAGEIETAAGRALPLPADVLDKNSLLAARETVMEQYGRIDILINCAGGQIREAIVVGDLTLFELTEEAYEKVVSLNLTGTLLPTQVFGQMMVEQGSGSIINISSMTAQRPLTRVIGYGNAKAAVDNLTKWLAVELAHKYGPGLRVNAIAPGFFVGEQNQKILLNEDGSYSERGRQIVDHTPFGRYGEPEELVGTAVWLASDASKFVTGIVVPVDGGFSAYSGV
jgi:NAD(P)-dependent dehydrogenase (short-subunit alcohol dehydrogenase family)